MHKLKCFLIVSTKWALVEMQFYKANFSWDVTIENLNNFVPVTATKNWNFAWKILIKTFSFKKIVAKSMY